jgi:hypothetical protein
MDIMKEFDEIINGVPRVLGKPIDKRKYIIIDRGLPHQPKSLPKQSMGIYTFWYEGKPLKIGKAGPKSNARFLSQHYNPGSAKNTLAKSILSDNRFNDQEIDKNNIGDWIKNNCARIDIIIDSDLGIFTLALIEAALHYKYDPIYEGFTSQR